MNIVGAIFARGGSKGVPRKNVRPLAGKPLIAYTIELARKCPSINRLIVSTDDEEIARTAREYGAEIPFMRPKDLAQDHSPEWLAWRHAIAWLRAEKGCDVLVTLPTTSPFRAVQDVEACVDKLLSTDADIVITVTDANRSPYFNMVELQGDAAHIAVKPASPIYRRQDAPNIYDMTTVAYAMRADFILKANNMFEGKVKAIIVPKERAVDIDDELDFQFAEFLMNNTPQPPPCLAGRQVTLRGGDKKKEGL